MSNPSSETPIYRQVYCEVESRYTYPVVNVYGINFYSNAVTYNALRDYQKNGTTALSPKTYDRQKNEWANYGEAVSGDYRVVKKVSRIDDNGNIQVLQYSYPVAMAGSTFHFIDIEAPFNIPFRYMVEFVPTTTTPNPVPIYSNVAVIDNPYLSPDDPTLCLPMLLSDPLVTSQGAWGALQAIEPITWGSRTTLHQVISRYYPVAQSDSRTSPTTRIRMLTKTLRQRTRVINLIKSGRSVLMRIGNNKFPERYGYISMADVTEERVIPNDQTRPERRWTFDVSNVERPYGLLEVLTPGRTYQTLQSFEPDGVTAITPATYLGIRDDYTTYLNALLGPTSSEDPSLDSSQQVIIDRPDLVYGVGRYPSAESVKSSTQWILN